MEKEEYKIMYNMEDNYWWYVGLRKLVFSSLDRFAGKKRNLNILDAGCGTGKILENCKAHTAYGLEISGVAIKFCKLRGLSNIVRGSILDIPFKNYSFDVLISLDVLYHIKVENDLKALKELYGIMNKDGILVLNLPAYNFLRSRHDEAIHTRHRYTLKELKEKVEKVGFRIERITYRNTILFPFAVIRRIIGKFFIINAEKVESDVKPLPSLFNKFLTMLLLFENKLIMSGIKFPFGLSLYCIAKKMKSS